MAQANNHDDIERFEEWKRLIGQQESQLQNLLANAFQVTNLYFVFQGVVFGAVATSSSLKCDDSWFVFSVSLSAGILHFFLLLLIIIKFLMLTRLHDITWRAYNTSAREVRGGVRRYSDEMIAELKTSRAKKHVIIILSIVTVLAFTGLILYSPWAVLCKHERAKHDLDCHKICNASKVDG